MTATLAALSLLLAAAPAGDPDPLELMKEAERRHRLPVELLEIEMVLQEKGGEKRVRTAGYVITQDKEDKAGDRLWIRFHTPGDIKGTTLLSIENKQGASDQWLWLPAFQRKRRVGGAELGDRFADTDLWYEDMKRRYVPDFTYKLLGSDKVDGHDCWVIEAVPSAEEVKKETPYGKSKWWLTKDSLLGIRLQRFDKKMKPLKEAKLTDFKQVKGDAWRGDTMTINDIQRDHRTVISVKKRELARPGIERVLSPHTFQE
jgi:hypothetical protein